MYQSYRDESLITKQVKFIEKLKQSDDASDKLESIRIYTGSHGYDINADLRNNKEKTTKYLRIIDNIDEVFKMIPPIEKSIIVYRTIDAEITDSYTDKGYISTTTDKYTEQEEYTCCTMVITIPAGTKILPIKGISQHPHENEILLERNGMFVYNNHKIVDNNFVVYVTYLSPKSDLIKQSDFRQVGELINLKFVEFLESKLSDIYDEYQILSEDKVTKNNFIEYLKIYIADFDKKHNSDFVIKSIIELLKNKIDELFIH